MEVLFGLLLLFALAITFHKRALAKKRLGQIDRGERCLACDRIQMQREGPIARCLSCGHRYNFAQMAWVNAGRDAHDLAGSTDRDPLD